MCHVPTYSLLSHRHGRQRFYYKQPQVLILIGFQERPDVPVQPMIQLEVVRDIVGIL
jgi:hypothetical protein